MAIEIVDFPIVMLVYQRVIPLMIQPQFVAPRPESCSQSGSSVVKLGDGCGIGFLTGEMVISMGFIAPFHQEENGFHGI